MSYELEVIPGSIFYPAIGAGHMYDDQGYRVKGATLIAPNGATQKLSLAEWAELYGKALLNRSGSGESPLKLLWKDVDSTDASQSAFQKQPTTVFPKKSDSRSK